MRRWSQHLGLVLVTVAGAACGPDESSGWVESGDPLTSTQVGSMGTPRGGHSVTTLADGLALVAGGISAYASELASAELYDPSSRAFSATGALSRARSYHTATRLNDGRVLIAQLLWLVLTCAAIPWPGLDIGRPLFRM